MLIKYICMQKIHMKQKYQYLINKRKKVVSNHYDDPKLLLSIKMIRKMFTKMFMDTIQIKIANY